MSTKKSKLLSGMQRIGFLVALLFVIGQADIASAATLYLTPSTGVYTNGSVFTARVIVNTEGKPINAAEGTITFNPVELTVVSVVKGSIFNLWTVEPSFSNSAGTINFGGGSPSGYTGSAGTILSVTFRVKGAGASKVGITRGSVLAADGLGTNILRSQTGGTYTLSATVASPDPEVVVEYVPPANTPTAPKITSSTHGDPSKWYNKKNAEASWVLPSGVTAVRTLLDESPRSIPTKVYESPISELTLSDLDDGENFLHVQLRNSDGWGQVAHYRLAVDTQKPTDFTIERAPGNDSYNPITELLFIAKDSTSPVLRFMVSVDGATPYEFIAESASSTHTLETLNPGSHTVVVEALDGAGNSIVSSFTFVIEAFGKPIFTDYPPKLRDAVVPVIKGSTKPGATVFITEVLLGSSAESDTREYQVVASEDGVFTFIPDSVFGYGVYEITAKAVDQDGAQSEVSDPIRIVVEEAGIVRIAGLAVTVLSLLIPLLALCVLLVILGLYSRRHIKKVLKIAGKETKEAEMVLEREFVALESALSTEFANISQARKSGKLTKAEQELFDILEGNISEAKDKIMKELTDIDSSLR